MSTNSNNNYKVPFIMMVVLFFLFGFLTVLNGQLQGPLKGVFNLSNTEATLLTFSFFTAFVVMGSPTSMLIDKLGYKKTLIVALLVLAVALAVFYVASLLQSFPIFVGGSFILGSGVTMLQVVANPYIAALGTPETAGWRINFAGAFNSLATTIAPLFASLVIFGGKAKESIVVSDVQLPYIGLTIFAILLAVGFSQAHLPQVGAVKAKEEKLAGSAWQFSHLTLGVLAIFCYVGAEVSIGNNLQLYLESLHLESNVAIGNKVALYWGGLMVGRFVGSSIFKGVDDKKGLIFVSLGSMILTLAGAFLPGVLGIYALMAVGLFHSVMWGYIFGLAIKGLGKYTNQASGYLLMGVFGGAVVPLAQGYLADVLGAWQITFAFVALCQAYLLFYALVGSKPNKVEVTSEEQQPVVNALDSNI